MKLKKIIVFFHLWLGLISGLVIFTVAITGSIYAFEEEIRNVIHRDLLKVKPSDKTSISIDDLLQIIKKEYPKDKIKSVIVRTDKTRSVQINLKSKTSVYIDPFTGKILGTIDQETEFLAVVLKIHRSLCLGDTGKMITGISALIFVIMLISGMFLWWPRNKALLIQKFSVKRNAHWKKLNYDLHSVLGFYASWIIIFTALTGIIFSFKWAEEAMYKATNSKKENINIHSLHSNSRSFSAERSLKIASVLFANSSEQVLLYPEDSTGIIRLNIRYKDAGFYNRQDQLAFDQYNGKLLKVRLFDSFSTGDKLKSTNYNIHTGKVLGLVGQLMVFFAALITASLPVTGLLLWRSKRKRKKN
jgi:uncharacterized iron-regulated membrane protein